MKEIQVVRGVVGDGFVKEKAARSKELVKNYKPVFKRFCRIYKIYGAV